MSKKSYVKPAILVEDFKLGNYVAGCGNVVSEVNLAGIETGCLTTDMQTMNMALGLFIDALGCTIKANSDNNTSGYCYYTYANSIFTS